MVEIEGLVLPLVPRCHMENSSPRMVDHVFLRCFGYDFFSAKHGVLHLLLGVLSSVPFHGCLPVMVVVVFSLQ